MRSSLLSHPHVFHSVAQISAQFVLPVAAGRGARWVAALGAEKLELIIRGSLHALIRRRGEFVDVRIPFGVLRNA